MPVNVHICDAILEKVHPESCFQKVFASVSDTVFSGDSTYIDISCVEKFEDFRQWLVCIVDCFEAGVLFCIPVTSFIEGQFFAGIWGKILMYFSTSGAGYAMCRPDSSLFLE